MDPVGPNWEGRTSHRERRIQTGEAEPTGPGGPFLGQNHSLFLKVFNQLAEATHIVEGNPFYANDLNANQIQKISSSKWGFDQTTGHRRLSQVDS